MVDFRVRGRRGSRILALSALLLFPIVASPGITQAQSDARSASGDASVSIDQGAAAWDALEALIDEAGALGSYFDESAGVVVVVPASGSSSFTVQDAAALGLNVTVKTADLEPADVAKIEDMLQTLAVGPAASDRATGFGFNPRTGKVLIQSSAGEALFAPVTETFPGKTSYQFTELSRLRHADFEPHWGGAKITSPQFPGASCSSGFAVLNGNLNPRMLTAAHCFDFGWTVNAWQSPGTTFGTVMRRDNFPTNDFELVGGGGVDHDPKIYVGNNSSEASRWVIGSTTPSGTYHSYCHSGARTGERCGYDYYISNYNYCDELGCTPNTQVFLANEGVQGACKGDSGAPFYRYSGTVYGSDVKVLGIVIASLDGDPDLCSGVTQVVIEKWPKIQTTYNVTLMVH